MIELKESVVDKGDNYWSTEKVEELLFRIEEEGLELKDLKNHPFYGGDTDLKKADLLWEYTPEEIKILENCARDVVYFAQFCKVMTDEGYMHIQLREYQESILKEYQKHRFNVFLAPRQVGKCFLPTCKVETKEKVLDISSLKLQKNIGFLEVIKRFLYKIYSWL
jgi:hypothetical protein